jgi:transcriptional regulator with GAF, ATPase, and Fis domain
LQKALQELTHSIHAAPNNKEIIGLKHRILKFFNVESADIYLLDRIKSELYTLTDKMKEKRLTIDDNSIPGHVAAGLKFIHLNINNGKVLSETEGSLMAGMDKIGGAVVREVMAAPIVFEDKLMGVLQLNNTKRDSEFRDVDPVLMQDIVEALGISLNNQEKLLIRTSFLCRGVYLAVSCMSRIFGPQDIGDGSSERIGTVLRASSFYDLIP